jgi:ketosteroid isomerase-like protein
VVGPVVVTLETADLWVVGDMAYEAGAWTYRYTPSGGTERVSGGRYVTVWRRQAGSGWRILADLSVPEQPVTPPR